MSDTTIQCKSCLQTIAEPMPGSRVWYLSIKIVKIVSESRPKVIDLHDECYNCGKVSVMLIELEW